MVVPGLPHDIGRGGKGLNRLPAAFQGLVAFMVRAAYYIAKNSTGVIHAMPDDHIIPTVTNPPTTTAQSATLLNLIKASMIDHYLDVAHTFAAGAHLAADETNEDTLAAVAAASPTDINTCYTLANACKATMNAHLAQSGVHFHDDGAAALATADATTPTTLHALVAALITFANLHYDRAEIFPGFLITDSGNEQAIVGVNPGGITVDGDIQGQFPNLLIKNDVVEGAELNVDALRVAAVTGHNGAFSCAATGLAVGDKIVSAFNLTTNAEAKASFEATVTVEDHLQQSSSSDLSADKFLVIVVAKGTHS